MKKDSMVKPPLALTLICLVVTAALVLTYQFTWPMIQEAKAAAADASRRQVMPEATEFQAVDIPAGLVTDPGQVIGIDKAVANGQTVGWVFTCAGRGYDGLVTVMCGIDANGALTKVKVTEHSETPGLGSRVAAESYTDNFTGATASTYEQIDGISGATFTSTAVKASIAAAFAGYEEVKEGI